MNLGDTSTNRTPATLILNASPDQTLLNHRAKVLHDAGYYTSSARSPDEAARHVASMHCALALICHSFATMERITLFERLQKLSPGTTIVCVEPDLDQNQHVLLAKVEEALARLSA